VPIAEVTPLIESGKSEASRLCMAARYSLAASALNWIMLSSTSISRVQRTKRDLKAKSLQQERALAAREKQLKANAGDSEAL
jgi:hypothetical protein